MPQGATKEIEIQGVGRFQVPADYSDAQVRAHIFKLKQTKPEIFSAKPLNVEVSPISEPTIPALSTRKVSAIGPEKPSWLSRGLVSGKSILERPAISQEYVQLGAERERLRSKLLTGIATDEEKQQFQDVDMRIRNIAGLAETASSFTSPLAIGTMGALPFLGRIPQLAASGYFLAQGTEEATKPPQTGETEQDILQRQLGGTGQALFAVPGLVQSIKPATKAITEVPARIREFANQNQRLEASMHDAAVSRIREPIAQLKEAVKTEAKQKITGVASQIDALPESTVDLNRVATRAVEILEEHVKIPEKRPEAMKLAIGGASEPVVVFGRPVPPGTPLYENLKESGVIDAGSFTKAWQVQQAVARTLVADRAGMSPQMKAALREVNLELKAELNGAAKKANLEQQWQSAKADYHSYSEDFTRSPVKKIIEAQNAQDISKPLTGKTGEQVRRILAKYQGKETEAGKHANEEINKVAELIKRAKSAQGRGELTKYDIGILGATAASAAVNPKLPIAGLAYEAARIGVPMAEKHFLIKKLKKAQKGGR